VVGSMDIAGNRALVTGGAGFIGSHLANKLIQLGCQVTVIDNLSFGLKRNVNKQANFIRMDICNAAELKEVISRINPKLIFHLAADATTKETAMGWYDPISDSRINTMGTLNLLMAVADLGIDSHIIYASSAAVYGEPDYIPIDENHPTNPVSPYGVSKLASEKYALAFFREQGVKSTILRIFNTYGPRQPRYVMFDLIKKLIENPDKLEVIGTGQQVRDYCHVSDTVNAFILASREASKGEVLNIAGGHPISIRELAEMIVNIYRPGGKTAISYTGKSWKGDINRLIADTTKIKERLGFKPAISLETGVSELVEWCNDGSDS
jgi:UDP-glucose 4-epimerase